jgi:hypothetical protein
MQGNLYPGSRQTEPVREWTVDEVNEALPWVTELVERIQASRASLRSGAPAQAGRTNGKAASDPRAPIRRAVEELMSQGIVLRDPDRGLVDFPATSPSGRRYWLCWVVGEPEVAWWHWEHAGFAGRQPLSTPPE